jgi:signal transduction histidine kinase
LHTITNTTDHVARLASDLLDVARLQAGSMPMLRTRLDIAVLVKQVVDGFRDLWAGQHELILDLDVQDVFVDADPDRLEQVLGKLLENAAKYTPPASTVRVVCTRADNGAQVAVIDQGIGLPDGAAAELFRPFTRAANAIDRHIKGLGLGLHIARQVVEAHGGRIWCTSDGDGQGSTFYVWLPLADAAPDPS